MDQAAIKKALDKLYNQGKISLKEKARIENLSMEDILEIIEFESLKPELKPVKQVKPKLNLVKSKTENEHEDRLRLIANIILIVGVISAVILFFSTALVTIKGSNSWKDETIFSWAGFATVITTLLYSVGGWAFLNVISNISISLKEIKGSK